MVYLCQEVPMCQSWGMHCLPFTTMQMETQCGMYNKIVIGFQQCNSLFTVLIWYVHCFSIIISISQARDWCPVLYSVYTRLSYKPVSKHNLVGLFRIAKVTLIHLRIYWICWIIYYITNVNTKCDNVLHALQLNVLLTKREVIMFML